MCPRNDESAGKRRSTRLRKGAAWLKTTLVQCAWAASRKKASYLQAQFHRLRGRRGPKKAICAVAASILTAAYHMLKDGTVYQDLGPDHFAQRSREVQARRFIRRLADLGYAVEITPLAAAD
jgi:transposase